MKNETLTFALKEVMEKQEITAQDLARQSGLAYRSVLDIVENRNRGISLRVLTMLCNSLHVTPNDLIQ